MQTTLHLKQLSLTDGMDIYEMLQRIEPSKNLFNNEAHGMTFGQFQKWLIEKDAWSRGEMLPEGFVKQWIYWLMDGDTPVGFGKLRERATEASRRFGGNIGYAVDPIARGKGYGNKLFELLLIQASKMGIHEIFSTVEKFNYISKKVHEKYGGKLISEDDIRWYFFFEV